MSERSRLDEIVEESPNTGPWRRCMMAIAERSFRHGVEQCNEMARRIRDGINWGRWDIVGEESVQPAPVENKDPDHNDACRRSCCNRRHAQRRKGEEARWYGTYENRRPRDRRRPADYEDPPVGGPYPTEYRWASNEKTYDSGLDYKGVPWRCVDRRTGQRRKGHETIIGVGS